MELMPDQDLLHLRVKVSASEKHTLHTGLARRLQICRFVSNENASGRIQLPRAQQTRDHSRCRLAAIASDAISLNSALWMMRAVANVVHSAAELFHLFSYE